MRFVFDGDGWDLPLCDRCGELAEQEDIVYPATFPLSGGVVEIVDGECSAVSCVCRFCRGGVPVVVVHTNEF